MVVIYFNDDSYLEIHSDMVLNGYKNNSNEDGFYLKNVFSDSIDGHISKQASKLATVNPKVGILGFILSVDCFSIGLDIENNTVYLSSAVKSVENSPEKGLMEPIIHKVRVTRPQPQ